MDEYLAFSTGNLERDLPVMILRFMERFNNQVPIVLLASKSAKVTLDYLEVIPYNLPPNNYMLGMKAPFI